MCIRDRYPTDHKTIGGRIVGEIHMDHVPLGDYRKMLFDKTTKEWREALHAIKGIGPLAPEARKRWGFGDIYNESPLAQFTLSWRQQMTGAGKITPTTRLLWMADINNHEKYDNIQALAYYDKFLNGDPAFQDDTVSYELCELGDKLKLEKGKGSPKGVPSPIPEPTPDSPNPEQPKPSTNYRQDLSIKKLKIDNYASILSLKHISEPTRLGMIS